MLKLTIVFFSIFFFACGNQKPNKLADGVIDKSQFPFPPNEEYIYPEEE